MLVVLHGQVLSESVRLASRQSQQHVAATAETDRETFESNKQQYCSTCCQHISQLQKKHAHLLSLLLPLLMRLLDCHVHVEYCVVGEVIALTVVESLEQGALAQQAVTLSFHCLQLLHQLLVLDLVLQAWRLS